VNKAYSAKLVKAYDMDSFIYLIIFSFSVSDIQTHTLINLKNKQEFQNFEIYWCWISCLANLPW